MDNSLISELPEISTIQQTPRLLLGGSVKHYAVLDCSVMIMVIATVFPASPVVVLAVVIAGNLWVVIQSVC